MNLCRTLPEVQFARSSCGRLFKLGAPSLVLEPLIQGTDIVKSGQKVRKAQMKERKNAKQRTIADLNVPNGSRDIAS